MLGGGGSRLALGGSAAATGNDRRLTCSSCALPAYKTPEEAHAAVPVFDYVICELPDLRLLPCRRVR